MVHFSLEVFSSSKNIVTVWFDLDNYTLASLQISKYNFETVKTGCTDDLVQWKLWLFDFSNAHMDYLTAIHGQL